jgi:hypothetical protein
MNGIRRPDNERPTRLKAKTVKEPCTLFVLGSQYVLFGISALACFNP